MAVDTRDKRFAMMSFGEVTAPTLPTPTGGFSTSAARSQLLDSYSMAVVDDGGPPIDTGPSSYIPVLRPRRR